MLRVDPARLGSSPSASASGRLRRHPGVFRRPEKEIPRQLSDLAQLEASWPLEPWVMPPQRSGKGQLDSLVSSFRADPETSILFPICLPPPHGEGGPDITLEGKR